MKKRKTKGVSPLVATVILAGFTVSLVALTILWSQGYLEERAQKEDKLSTTKMGCEEIKIGINEVYPGGDGSELHITIENKGSKDIDSFAMRITDSATESFEYRQALASLQSRDFVLGSNEFDATAVGDLSKATVTVIPMLKAGKGVYIPCSGKSLESRMTR